MNYARQTSSKCCNSAQHFLMNVHNWEYRIWPCITPKKYGATVFFGLQFKDVKNIPQAFESNPALALKGQSCCPCGVPTLFRNIYQTDWRCFHNPRTLANFSSFCRAEELSLHDFNNFKWEL